MLSGANSTGVFRSVIAHTDMKIVSKLGASASLIVGITAAHSSIYIPNLSDFSLQNMQLDTRRTPSSVFKAADVIALQNTVYNTAEQTDFLDANYLVFITYFGTSSIPFGVFPNAANKHFSAGMINGRWPIGRSSLSSLIARNAADSTAGTVAPKSAINDNKHRSGNAKADAGSEADLPMLAILGLGLVGFAIVRRGKRKSAK